MSGPKLVCAICNDDGQDIENFTRINSNTTSKMLKQAGINGSVVNTIVDQGLPGEKIKYGICPHCFIHLSILNELKILNKESIAVELK